MTAKFPTPENREKFLEARRRKYAARQTNYPATIQDAVQRLLKSIETAYESGEARIICGVDIRVNEVDGLSFDVKQYNLRSKKNGSAAYTLARLIEMDFLRLLLPELDDEKVEWFGSGAQSTLLHDSSVWKFTADLIVRESSEEEKESMAIYSSAKSSLPA